MVCDFLTSHPERAAYTLYINSHCSYMTEPKTRPYSHQLLQCLVSRVSQWQALELSKQRI